MKKLIFSLGLLIVLKANAQQNIHIVPEPVSIKMGTGFFMLNDNTVIVSSHPSLQKTAELLQAYIQNSFDLSLKIVTKGADNHHKITLGLQDKNIHDAAYRLSITEHEIAIIGATAKSVFYGMQTLLQVFPARLNNDTKTTAFQVTQLNIQDQPRFKYRGMHLDVVRHFQPVSFVKKYIDYLAFHKFNNFHWHLTDDQGWRIEIKKYPKLTAIGGYRNGTIIGRYPGTGNDSLYYGGYYTQEQIKEVVQYAAERFINVYPEIELPGHASAAIAAYPQLSCFPNEDTKIPLNTVWAGSKSGKQVQQTWGVFEDVFCPTEYTFNFLENVLDEVMELFPSPYIHIGGDECPKDNWKRSEFCQQLIKEKDLKDEHGLQSYFIQRIEKYVNKKGKKIIGWDEILEGGLAPNATVMSWRGEAGGIAAAQQKHDVIMTPGAWMYFDHSQSRNEDSIVIGGYTPLEKVYGYEPIPEVLTAEEAKHILGAQANLWAEYIKYPSKIEYMVFPRMSALSEVLWSGKEKRNWKKFQEKLPALFARYNTWNASYSLAYYDLEAKITQTKDHKIAWQLQTKHVGGKIIYADVRDRNTTHTYSSPIVLDQSRTLIAAMVDENNQAPGIWMQQKFSINKATGKPIRLSVSASTKYAGNGEITLVDGIQNSRGMSSTSEFLGFTDSLLQITVDLLTAQPISSIRLHALQHPGSWIYGPSLVEVWSSSDGNEFKKAGTADSDHSKTNLIYSLNKSVEARYIKLIVKNNDLIPTGMPGAGRRAWLFLDELEIE